MDGPFGRLGARSLWIAAALLLVGGCSMSEPVGVSEWVTVETGLGVILDVPAEWEIDPDAPGNSWSAGVSDVAVVHVFVGNNTQTQTTANDVLAHAAWLKDYAGRDVVYATLTTVDSYTAVRTEHYEGGSAGGPLRLDVDDVLPGGSIEWAVFPHDDRKIEVGVGSEVHSRVVFDRIGRSIRISDCLPWSDLPAERCSPEAG